MDYIGLSCCALAFVLYLNTLNAGFVYDDRRAILGNPDVLGKTPWRLMFQHDFWGTPLTDTGTHGSYRPLCVLTYKINHIVDGFRPIGYHLVNVLLHCLATGLVVKLSRQLLPPFWGPAVAGGLFATHPIHTEAVAGIVGRADLAACNFYLLSFLAYLKHVSWRNSGDIKQWLALFISIIMASAAILCKETAITALVICGCYECMKYATGSVNKQQLRSLCIIAVVFVIIIHMRLSLPGPTVKFSNADNPIAKCNSLWVRFLTFTYLPAFNFRLLVIPTTLSFDWGMDAVPRIGSIFDFRNIITVIFYTTFMRTVYINLKFLKKRVFEESATLTEFGAKDSNNNISSIPTKRKARLAKSQNNSQSECVCVTCKTDLNIRHSSTCRAINNNNIPSPFTKCGCQLLRHRTPSPEYHCESNSSVNSYNFHIIKKTISLPRSSSVSSQSAAVLFSLALLALPFLPAANVFFYVGFVVAERILYLPSVGYCLLVGAGVAHLMDPKRGKLRQKRGIVFGLLATLLFAYSAKTITRNLDWKNEECLYRSAIYINPPKALGNLGSVLSSEGRFAEAKIVLMEALRYRPNMADVHYNLGVLFQNQGDFAGGVECFQKAIQLRPSLALAYLNLGTSLIALGRCQEAATVLRLGSRVDGVGVRDRHSHEIAQIGSLLQLGNLYVNQGKLQRALAIYREALHIIPHNYPPRDIYNRLGDVLTRLHQWSEAERFHIAALDLEPNNVATHISYGIMLTKNVSRILEAEEYFKRALQLAPTDASVHHHYAEFLSLTSRQSEECVERVKAAELSSNNYSLVLSAATALRLLDRISEAEKWYRRAVILRPFDARSHTNLGAILHLLGRLNDAAASYKNALQIQPHDKTTLSNLAKLDVKTNNKGD